MENGERNGKGIEIGEERMVSESLKNKLLKSVKGEVRFNEPLSDHSTIKIGGKADIFILPENADDLTAALRVIKEEDESMVTIGAGSNVLFRDGGVGGVMINMSKLSSFSVKEESEDGVLFEAEAGVLVNELTNFSVNEGFHGFEGLTGIPGTVGGAVCMNAGSSHGSISDVLLNVTAIDRSGKLCEWPKEKIEFSYRNAKFPRACVVIKAGFKLKRGSKEDITSMVNELRANRKEKQPLKWPSLGSIFKNPEKGPAAGVLIEEAGLKGVRVGGARISDIHGNWIINEGGATSKDIEVLIHLVKEKVKEASGVSLEPEIVIVGRK